jgi:hypothetical protein
LADAEPETLRISIDTKATIQVGKYSRGGKSRGLCAVEAWDHDMYPRQKLVPGGILEPDEGKSFLFFGTSKKTSDFLADGLERWWLMRKAELAHIKKLVIYAGDVLHFFSLLNCFKFLPDLVVQPFRQLH